MIGMPVAYARVIHQNIVHPTGNVVALQYHNGGNNSNGVHMRRLHDSLWQQPSAITRIHHLWCATQRATIRGDGMLPQYRIAEVVPDRRPRVSLPNPNLCAASRNESYSAFRSSVRNKVR